MKQLRIALLGLGLLASATLAQAQFYIGPALNAGMTYSKNFITPDTSQYYIANSPSLHFAGGLDFGYQFDENIRVMVGGAYSHKQFVLKAPEGAEGLSFTEIKRKATAISVPLTVHYRFPIGEGGKAYFNVIAGHSFDFTREDSLVLVSSFEPVDSGTAFTRHYYNNPKRTLGNILLGLGSDIQFANGNILNVSAVWGIGTGKIFEGTIMEWNVLNQDYDPQNPEQKLPEEFPEHFYEWALRGSTLSIRASYWFDLSNLFKGGDDEGGDKEDKPASDKPHQDKGKGD